MGPCEWLVFVFNWLQYYTVIGLTEELLEDRRNDKRTEGLNG